jgi:hypothetical protein
MLRRNDVNKVDTKSARLSVDPEDGLAAALNEEGFLGDDDPEEKVGLCTCPFRTTATFEHAVADVPDPVEGA